MVPKQNCLILGAGRSGTSLTALLLERAGYHVYATTYPPGGSNPMGYFEDIEVNVTNDAILAPFYCSLRGRLARMLRQKPRLTLSQAWLLDLHPSQLHHVSLPQIHKETFQRLFDRVPFAYKDPRFSFTLGVLAPLLPTNTVYICVFRDAREVVESTRKHAGTYGMILDDKYCFAVWEAHYRCILEHRRSLGGEWLFVSHRQFMDGVGVPRLEQFLELPLDRKLVRKELKRSQARGILPSSVERLSEQLEELSSDCEDRSCVARV